MTRHATKWVCDSFHPNRLPCDETGTHNTQTAALSEAAEHIASTGHTDVFYLTPAGWLKYGGSV